MKTKKIFIIAALLGTVLAGCQKSEIIVPDKNPETGEIWTLKVQVSKAKALGVSGSEVYAYWKDNEKVAVYLDGAKLGSLVATAGSPSTRATLVGNISRPAGLAVNSSLTLLFPGRDDNEWTYVGQDGSAPSEDGTMATLFDYSTASLNVDAIDEGTHTITASVTNGFTNQQSVYRFGFKVGGAGSAIAVKSFIISSRSTGGGVYSRSSGIVVSLKNFLDASKASSLSSSERILNILYSIRRLTRSERGSSPPSSTAFCSTGSSIWDLIFSSSPAIRIKSLVTSISRCSMVFR